jgi:hypothetical protein
MPCCHSRVCRDDRHGAQLPVIEEAEPCSRSCSSRIGCFSRIYATMSCLILNLRSTAVYLSYALLSKRLGPPKLTECSILMLLSKTLTYSFGRACATGPSYAVPMGRCVKALGTSDLSEKLNEIRLVFVRHGKPKPLYTVPRAALWDTAARTNILNIAHNKPFRGSSVLEYHTLDIYSA